MVKVRHRKISRRGVSHLVTLEDVSALISHSEDLQGALGSIVTIVVQRMETEVCSIYLLDRRKNSLVLAATTGLDREAVGKVSMGIDEGLTGLVIEQMRPLKVVDAVYPLLQGTPIHQKLHPLRKSEGPRRRPGTAVGQHLLQCLQGLDGQGGSLGRLAVLEQIVKTLLETTSRHRRPR